VAVMDRSCGLWTPASLTAGAWKVDPNGESRPTEAARRQHTIDGASDFMVLKPKSSFDRR